MFLPIVPKPLPPTIPPRTGPPQPLRRSQNTRVLSIQYFLRDWDNGLTLSEAAAQYNMDPFYYYDCFIEKFPNKEWHYFDQEFLNCRGYPPLYSKRTGNSDFGIDRSQPPQPRPFPPLVRLHEPPFSFRQQVSQPFPQPCKPVQPSLSQIRNEPSRDDILNEWKSRMTQTDAAKKYSISRYRYAQLFHLYFPECHWAKRRMI